MRSFGAGSQQVWIGGKYECDIVTLHSTVNQVVCKTRPALEGSWTQGRKHPIGGTYAAFEGHYNDSAAWQGHRVPLDSYFRYGWTESMRVVVYVNGRVTLSNVRCEYSIALLYISYISIGRCH